MIDRLPRQDDWDEDPPIFFGLGTISTVDANGREEPIPLNKEPIGFIHFDKLRPASVKSKKKKARKRGRK